MTGGGKSLALPDFGRINKWQHVVQGTRVLKNTHGFVTLTYDIFFTFSNILASLGISICLVRSLEANEASLEI